MANDGSVVIDIEGDSSKFQKSLSKLGSVASGALKGLGVAAAAAASAVVAVGTAAVTAYADYEQLVGGVETLFGAGGKSLEEYAASVGKTVADAEGEYARLMEAQNTVMEYANNAYKTSGLSANAYMETVTGISASLIASLGGDTVAAAQVADRAVTDMADNANKMGTDIALIQNAYQGFAKQNYTMLDNLKLGYGGTQEEMKRLIADASKMTEVQERLGITVDASSMSFDNVVNAISVMQESMGIAGATAAEASSTIQGSLAMTKASWENLLVGLADDTQDFDTLLTNFIDSVTTLGENLIPRIQVVLEGIVKLVSALGPKLAEMLPGIVETVLPGLISGVTSIVSALVDVIPGLLDTLVQVVLDHGPTLIQAGLDLILSFCNGITSALPGLMTATAEIVTTLVTSLSSPEFLVNLVTAAADMLMALADGLIAAVPILIQAIPVIFQNLITAITESLPVLLECALSLVQTLATGIAENLPLLVESALSMVDSLVTGIKDNLPMIVETTITLVETLIQTLIDNLPMVIETAIEIALALIQGLLSCIPDLITAAIDLATSLLETILETDWVELGSNILDLLIEGLFAMINSVVSTAGEVASALWDAICNIDWWSLGADIISGIANGVLGAIGTLADAAWQVAQNALDTIKSALGINSPSKVFAKEVGRWIPPGIGEGAEDAMPELNADMRKSLMHTVSDASAAVAAEVGGVSRRLASTGHGNSGTGDTQVVTNENGITVIVYYSGPGDTEDVKKLGRKIGTETYQEMRRKGLPMK